MKEPTKNKTVRFSSCKTCKGFVRAMALERVDGKQLSSFEREVKKYDLEVTDMKLKKWQKHNIGFCKCVSKN